MIITIILLIITGIVTVFYFKNISQASLHPADVLKHVPSDAFLVTEFTNDDSFYDAFSGSGLFTSILGPVKTKEYELLRKYILQTPALKSFFANQPVYISLHPGAGEQVDLLVTTTASSALKTQLYKTPEKLAAQGVKVEVIKPALNKLIKITIPDIGRSFFISEDEDHIFSASFSLPLLRIAAEYGMANHKLEFLQVADQQHNNALSILYVNYKELKVFLNQIFKTPNAELLRPFRLLEAQAALSLNYKKDALMFNGLTQIDSKKPASYLNLFTSQQPVENDLKDIYPSTTAYSTTFAVSDIPKFVKDLSVWNGKSGLLKDETALFDLIKKETGVQIDHDINHQLGNEFGLLTTRFQERLAIIELKNGQQLYPSLMNISTMRDDNIGQFNYEKVPFFLFGDAFSIFKKPYFMVINNYLVLANTPGELHTYLDSYNNQKFLSKNETYNSFDNLSPEKSNISFFINFKNAAHVFERDMKPVFYHSFADATPGFRNFYAMSLQLGAADNNYYTNLCLKLNEPDSTQTNNSH